MSLVAYLQALFTLTEAMLGYSLYFLKGSVETICLSYELKIENLLCFWFDLIILLA